MSAHQVSSKLLDLRKFWRSDPSSRTSEAGYDNYGLQHQNEREHLRCMQPLKFEFSRHVLKKVSKTIKYDSKNDASWLNTKYIKPSTELGCPITVKSSTEDMAKIQNIWENAVKADPTIMDEGALILDAKKEDGTSITGVDISKYNINPNAVQSNVVSKIEDTPTVATNATHDSAGGPSPAPFSSPTPAPADEPNQSSDMVVSPSPAGVKVPQGSPRAVSPTSTLRSNSSSLINSPDAMMLTRPYVASSPSYHAEEQDDYDDADISSVSPQQSPSRILEPRFHLRMQETPVIRGNTTDTVPHDNTPDAGTQTQAGGHERFSSSTAFSTASPSSATTVSFQANITTGGNVTTIPFTIDNIIEAVDDIMAFAQWKNSDSGRGNPVDFRTFVSIMRYRTDPSNALVLHKRE